ncbi:hypothetical protein KC331_g3672 [Hortaea werneckii]|nr:hypothetical protein KC331_g3672 [Hortaea werneckii]KAI7717793.1 hypothetical protein KC353_g4309 [Hortaea werneckii]
MAVNYSAPAAQPPPSYASGSDGPEIKGVTAGHWLDSVGLVLTTLFLGLRIYTKTAISRIFGVDDVCMILVAIASILYAPVMMFAKISLLIFYKKLTPARWMQITVWTVGAFVLAYTVATVLALLFACTPLEKNWNITIQNGQCINKGGIYLFTAAVNALTDLIILGIPVPMVFHLQMSRAQKMGLLIMFVVGSLFNGQKQSVTKKRQPQLYWVKKSSAWAVRADDFREHAFSAPKDVGPYARRR